MSENVVERVARFLRLNYRPGTTDVPWGEASADEREAWLAEAAHVVALVRPAETQATETEPRRTEDV